MTNLVPIAPTRNRKVPKSISMSDKLIRFSSSVTNRLSYSTKYVNVTFDQNLNRMYFLVSKEDASDRFLLRYYDDKKAYSFSSRDICTIFRSYIPSSVVTAKFPVTFVTNEYFYIEFTNWYDGSRTSHNKKGKVVMQDE